MEFQEKIDIRTLKKSDDILKLQYMSDDVWIKISGVPSLNDRDVPDDMPLPKELYIGPFPIYDF
ncbi:MAG TPA: hypothetical protein ENH19_01180 [Actinobacteria bacterium]|nr:hypothetical protein [Actinomycetes bacterium]HEX21248.1 hypothetical protein [Actinomycetota bacterium]